MGKGLLQIYTMPAKISFLSKWLITQINYLIFFILETTILNQCSGLKIKIKL